MRRRHLLDAWIRGFGRRDLIENEAATEDREGVLLSVHAGTVGNTRLSRSGSARAGEVLTLKNHHQSGFGDPQQNHHCHDNRSHIAAVLAQAFQTERSQHCSETLSPASPTMRILALLLLVTKGHAKQY